MGFAELTQWAVPRLRAILGEDVIRSHQDTLGRLLGGDFKDLSEQERQLRVEEIIQVSAGAAVALAALPIPFLDLPILVAMVGAIGRVHGLQSGDTQMYTQVLGTLGGGLFLRQVLRAVPFGGAVYASQIYGAAWGLGHVAHSYCIQHHLPDSEELKRIFAETLKRKAEEHQRKKQQKAQQAAAPQPAGQQAAPHADAEQRLKELAALKEKNLISQQEYEQKRQQILSNL